MKSVLNARIYWDYLSLPPPIQTGERKLVVSGSQGTATLRNVYSSWKFWLPGSENCRLTQSYIAVWGKPNCSPCAFFFFFFWLHWVFVAVRGLCLVAASGGHPSPWCTGPSWRWLLSLQSTGSRRAGFSSCGTRALVVARGL